MCADTRPSYSAHGNRLTGVVKTPNWSSGELHTTHTKYIGRDLPSPPPPSLIYNTLSCSGDPPFFSLSLNSCLSLLFFHPACAWLCSLSLSLTLALYFSEALLHVPGKREKNGREKEKLRKCIRYLLLTAGQRADISFECTRTHFDHTVL